MVRIWEWMLTNVFRYRRVLVYMRNGSVLKLTRDQRKSVEATREDFMAWMSTTSKTIKFRNGKRCTIIRVEDVQGVDIR